MPGIQRQTLKLLTGLTFGLALSFFALAVVTAFVVEDLLIDKLVNERAREIEQRRQGQAPGERSERMRVFASLEQVPPELRRAIDPARQGGEIFTSDASHYHYRRLDLGSEPPAYLLAEVSDLLVVTNQPGIFVVFALGLAGALLLAWLLAYRFAHRITQPILALTDAVQKRRHAYEPLPTLPHELGYLARTLEDSFSQLEHTLQRERAFTADASHELRTPVTVLNNTCALIAQRGFQTNDWHTLARAGEQMRTTLEVLLALARFESLHRERCAVRALLEQAALARADGKPFQLELDIAPDFRLNANPTLLRLLFDNLFDNALTHGEERQVYIRQETDALVFENPATPQGTGVAGTALTEAGVRRSDSPGAGQGLFLVTRIIERFGWAWELEQRDSLFRFIIKP